LSTVREVTYEVLRQLGMNVISGNPGSTELPFLRDMPSDFRYVLGLHERAAAGMGLGYALATGKAAFVNLHSIASSGNGLSTLVDAWYSHVPLVVTTGQQDRRQVLSEPFLISRAVETVRPYVKWAYEPLRAEDVPAAIVQAYHLALQAPMGPVFLSIPMDDWTHECQPVNVRDVRRSVLADPAALDDVVRALDGSRNPAMVTGAQVEEDGGWHEILALANTSTPTLTSSRSRRVGRFREHTASFAADCFPLNNLWPTSSLTICCARSGRSHFPVLRLRPWPYHQAGNQALSNHELASAGCSSVGGHQYHWQSRGSRALRRHSGSSESGWQRWIAANRTAGTGRRIPDHAKLSFQRSEQGQAARRDHLRGMSVFKR
jgi:Thiamine pyrophosphate enzyme, N-terminal TPP binding domain